MGSNGANCRQSHLMRLQGEAVAATIQGMFLSFIVPSYCFPCCSGRWGQRLVPSVDHLSVVASSINGKGQPTSATLASLQLPQLLACQVVGYDLEPCFIFVGHRIACAN